MATLANQPGSPAADLEWASPIPAETARRLACDAAVTPIFLDSESSQPRAGQTSRSISGSQRKALVFIVALMPDRCAFGAIPP